MPYLATVRDGSTGELVPGYWCGVALAAEPSSRRVLPLLQQLWSADAPDFVSENAQLLGMVDTIATATDRRGIYVLDRGGDRSKLYLPLLARGLCFIIRLVGDRHLVVRGRLRRADDLARGVQFQYAVTVVREAAGGEKKCHLEYGFRKVKLPGRRDVDLTLVVVKGFGAELLLLLTNVPVKASRRSVWRIVRGDLTRWLVEETIRFVKQCYRLEDLRVLSYERLRNPAGRDTGDGGGVFCGGVVGGIVETGGVGQSGVEGGQTVLWSAGVSLLCVGRWPAGVAVAVSSQKAPSAGFHLYVLTLAFSLHLKNRGKS